MKTVSSENIRKEITDIANKVRFQKENYILTKNNKPYVGIVPLETIQLLNDIIEASSQNKAIAEITQNYMITITKEDKAFLEQLLANPKPMNSKLQKAAKSAKAKINNL